MHFQVLQIFYMLEANVRQMPVTTKRVPLV
jgi:hypothetical protein